MACSAISASRDRLPFDIDGVVYKLDDRGQQAMGFVARAALGHRAQVPGAGTEHNGRGHRDQIGRTGAATPVARLAPWPWPA